MIVEHYGLKVKIPPMQFGNETDMQIRDALTKLGDLTRRRKTPIPKQEQKVKAVMVTLQNLVKQKNT